VRTHPVTGRKCLFVNQSYTTHIVGISKDESRAILGYLFHHCTNPNFQVRFRWTPHAVAFWDNRCTQHLAVWDYFPQTRSGYRVTISGDKPV
jgi:taurine dioxygenase